MARLARVINPGYPHHVIQRGNRRQNVFFSHHDKDIYLNILEEQSRKYGVKFWAYCLMDNHIHLVAVPCDADSLARAIGETHRRYTRMINFREGWRGYLWQGRFSSFPVGPSYLYNLIRYVERNPVRAGIVQNAEDYTYSSAWAHVYGIKSGLLSDFWLLKKVKNWRKYLREKDREEFVELFRSHVATGRPFGEEEFIDELEKKLDIILKKQKPGPKPKN